MLKPICMLLLLPVPARANPPSAAAVLAGEKLERAKVHWVRQEKGAPLTVEVFAGEAFRANPDWNPQPVKLPYDLKRNAGLLKMLRAARLGPTTKKPPRRGERTLELLVEGDKGWDVVGRWTRPARSWRKQLPALYDELEPLCDVLSDVFQPVAKDAAKSGNLKLTPN